VPAKGVALRRRAPVLADFLEGVADEAQTRWGVHNARAFFVAPFLVAPSLVVLRYVTYPAYMTVVGEDRIFEWAQVGLFVAAAFFAFRLCLKYLRNSDYPTGVMLVLAGALLLFAAGEEISWGQRLLGWETPAALRARNVQEETTIHNDSSLRWAFHVGMLLIGIFGFSTPLLRKHGSIGRRSMHLPDKLIPPIFLASYFLVVAVGMTIYLSQIWLGDVMIIKFSEFWETCFAIAITWHLYLLAHDRPFRTSERLPPSRAVGEPSPR
jgi:hypothetical protein